MNKTVKIFAAGAFLAMAVSCDLDLTPKGSITYNPGDQIITSASDLTAFEANVMASFRGLEYGVYDMASDIMVDYFNAAADFGNNYGPVHRTDANFTTGDYEIEDNWAGPYTAIKNFNIFINGAKEVPAALKAKADIARGEAFLGRAYAYMHLARHFGKPYSANAATDPCVPLVVEYDQTARPERASVADIYGQIKTDLDSAAVLLAGVEGEARAERPTIDMVNAVYARYYLDVKDYKNAAASAMKVINTENYKVSSTPAEMKAEWIDDEGNEPIMQFFANLNEGQGSHSNYTGMRKDDQKGLYYQPYFIPTKTIVEAYDEGDVRFAQWFDASYPSYHVSNWYNEDKTEYYVFTKYFGNPDLYTGNPNTAQAIKPILISEMYLIAAEAYLADNDAASAKVQLNALQVARGAKATDATTENIQNEWYRETVGEGLRFSCLKRWGIGFSGRPPQDGAADVIMTGASFEQKAMPASDYHYQWPIPLYEMQTNLNLKQNDGYSVEQ